MATHSVFLPGKSHGQSLMGYSTWDCKESGHGFPDSSFGKESTCNAGDLGSIPGLGRFPGEGKGYPLQYPGLENGLHSPWGCKELDMTE